MINRTILFIVLLLLPLGLMAKEEAIVGLADHELGDQTLSIQAGFLIPLFFQDFDGNIHDDNLVLGGTGAIQWNAYLNPVFRIGLEVSGAFSFGPNDTSFLMLPILVKGGYLLSYSRFEFPVTLGAGINILKYGNDEDALYDVALCLKPGVSAFWRYDSNLSFGLNLAWWWNLEFPVGDSAAMVGNFLEISPTLFYHF